jgi:hypothetical protein
VSSPHTPSGGLLVAETAQILLDCVVEHYRAAGEPLPGRRYIAAGGVREVAYDCEQVTVACAGIGQGASDDRTTGSTQPGTPSTIGLRHAVFAVSVVRAECSAEDPEVADDWTAADYSAPRPEVLTRIGIRHMRDLALVSQALVNATTRVHALPAFKALGKELPRRDMLGGLVRPGTVDSLGPAGGFVSVEAAFTLTIGLLG